MIERVAICACGQVSVSCQGEPALVSLCHCLDCKRRTGSAFGIGAFFDEARVAISGATRTVSRIADSGFAVHSHFCPSCGSTLFWYPDRKPGFVAVAFGAFADPGFPAPTQAVYKEQREDWLRLRLSGDKA